MPSESTRFCLNCGFPSPIDARRCPHCGENPDERVWPKFDLAGSQSVKSSEFLMGSKAKDITAGLMAAAGSLFAFGIGLFIIPLMILTMRRYRYFVRGVVIGGVIILVSLATFAGLYFMAMPHIR